MNEFVLLDGAMVAGALGTSPYFADPKADGVASLMPREEALRLVGPLLLDWSKLCSLAPAMFEDIRRVCRAYPHMLHVSVCHSALELDALAEHLRAFACFFDALGHPYGLRMADCRVLSYLPDVLTEAQWNAMTAPMAQWEIHDRAGKMRMLRLHDGRLSPLAERPVFRLDDAQIEALMQAGEADLLLSLLGLQPEATALQHVQANHDTERACLACWQQRGSADRGLLIAFARSVFKAGAAVLKDSQRTDALWVAAGKFR